MRSIAARPRTAALLLVALVAAAVVVLALASSPVQIALRRFQRRKCLAADGLVGPDVRSALLGRLPALVDIDLSEYTLTLLRGGTPTRSYRSPRVSRATRRRPARCA